MPVIKIQETGIFFLRIFGGFLMVYGHGWPKLMRLLSGDPIRFADPLGLGPTLSFVLVIFAEFLCASLVILGLFTRLSTIPLVFSLSVAAFIHHSGDPFRNKELALLFLLIFFTLFLTGPGSYSLHKGLNIKSRLSKKLDFILQ
jgi:putative oxidoreductase